MWFRYVTHNSDETASDMFQSEPFVNQKTEGLETNTHAPWVPRGLEIMSLRSKVPMAQTADTFTDMPDAKSRRAGLGWQVGQI